MSKTLTPLVISTARAHAPGAQYTWNKLQNPQLFISEIVTQDVNLQSDELNRLVSGVPTPFARAAMFRYALDAAAEAAPAASGLMKFYRSLQDEWKGLVACLALDNQDISVERIDLAYSDGRDLGTTANVYEPTGALGTMLFEAAPLWCDQSLVEAEGRRQVPFIYLIKHRGAVVGGTAPESLLFTAATYRVESSKGVADEKTGRFTDPLKTSLTQDDLVKLWLYVRHLADRLGTYRDQFAVLKPRITPLATFVERWLREIELKARDRGVRLDPNAIKPTFARMGAPYDVLFNIENTLYGYRGRIAGNRQDLAVPDGSDIVEVELDALLLDPAISTVTELILNDPADEAKLGVHVLKVTAGKNFRFFALPLSERGLAIFQDGLDSLLDGVGDVKSRLRGTFDQASETLKVTLELDVNGSHTVVEKSYTRPHLLQGNRVICWPDFVAAEWNRYYLYSEVPHNGAELRAYPLRADRATFALRGEGVGEDFRFERLYENGRPLVQKESADLLIEYDLGRINASEMKYEIYQSEHPFKALELRHRDRVAGFVVFRNPNSSHPHSLRKQLVASLDPVRVGIDFGSNNSCVSYQKENDTEQKLLHFQNRRRLLLGVENAADPRLAATPGEVFFFQNEPTRSNTIKSMVMIHDERRIRGYTDQPLIPLEREVTGGFPVFEKNVPVEESTETMLSVRFDAQPSYIKYNMKWSQDDKENAYKKGLLKTLWLKTYAELFALGLHPKMLVWAYPSAMNAQTRMHYSNLWSDVVKLNPLATKGQAEAAQLGGGGGTAVGFAGAIMLGASSSGEREAQTEASAVCRHALAQGATVARDAIFIGFDVGGSTTDILCVASKRSATGDYRETLIKEGSIRLAAGMLSDATKKSKRFQDVLRQYCQRTNQVIHGVTVPPDRLNSATAAFYYNQLIDRLETPQELEDLYKGLAANCPELFSLNAYMTGLILYYAGQMAALVRQVQAANPSDYITPFQRVTIGCFGKGGRMFDWLPAAVGNPMAMAYFQTCFAKGYGPTAQADLRGGLEIRPSDPKHVKAEVSFGLASTRDVEHTTDKIAEIVGEDGYEYDGIPLSSLQGVESKHLQHFGNQLAIPEAFPRFSEFVTVFRDFCKSYFGLNMPNIQQDVARMRLVSYVQNLPGYHLARQAAQKGEPFDFEAPFIVLEGMCFLDQVLQPHLFDGK